MILYRNNMILYRNYMKIYDRRTNHEFKFKSEIREKKDIN